MADTDQVASGRKHIEVGYSEQTESYTVEYDRDVGQSIGTCVVLGVAEVSGIDPVELQQLNSVVDAEALDALFDHSRQGSSSDHVSFNYHGYRVTVYRDDEILLQPHQHTDPWSPESGTDGI